MLLKLNAVRLLVGVVGTVAAAAVFAQVGIRAGRSEPMFTVRVVEQGSTTPISHPMVCIREFRQPLGAIGDSLGQVVFGGRLPLGTLHLQIVAPGHLPVDTTIVWPVTEQARPMIVSLRPRQGPPVQPRCIVDNPSR